MYGRTIAETIADPDFTTISGLRDAIEELPRAELQPASYGEGRNVPHRRAVVTEGGQFVEFVSDRYTLQQHQEALEPVARAVEDLDVSFRGGLVGYHNQDGSADQANVKVAIIFDQDERFRTDLQAFDVGLGIVAGNSLDKTGALEVQAIGINGYCSNGMVMGRTFGRVRQKHMGRSELEAAKEEAVEFITGLAQQKHLLEERIREAQAVEIRRDEIRPLVSGIGVPDRHAEPISEALKAGGLLTDEQREGGLTVAKVYNGVTNYYTHTYDRSNRQAERILANAEGLLTEAEERVVEVRAEA